MHSKGERGSLKAKKFVLCLNFSCLVIKYKFLSQQENVDFVLVNGEFKISNRFFTSENFCGSAENGLQI